MLLRIGHGFDVHAFSEERRLVLGGLEIADSGGLLGHSDADVVLHSLTDSVLGALALGDIGSWFPDTDDAFKDANSAELLAQVWKKVHNEEGWQLVNCDIVIMAQKPKIQAYVIPMRARIAEILRVDSSQIGVKATTTENLGFVGRKEGIACSSVVLLKKDSQ